MNCTSQMNKHYKHFKIRDFQKKNLNAVNSIFPTHIPVPVNKYEHTCTTQARGSFLRPPHSTRVKLFDNMPILWTRSNASYIHTLKKKNLKKFTCEAIFLELTTEYQAVIYRQDPFDIEKTFRHDFRRCFRHPIWVFTRYDFCRKQAHK